MEATMEKSPFSSGLVPVWQKRKLPKTWGQKMVRTFIMQISFFTTVNDQELCMKKDLIPIF